MSIPSDQVPIRNRWLDTNRRWIKITLILAVVALTAHGLAEYFGLYDVTNVDVYTHFLSSFAVIALLLNLNLGRKRRYYWIIPIVIAMVVGLLWEGAEELSIRFNIAPWVQNEFWNALQDLFQDTLGGIVAGYFCDEVVP